MNLSPGKYCSKDIALFMYDGTNRKQFQNCFEISEGEYPNGFSITAVRLKQSTVGADWNKTIYGICITEESKKASNEIRVSLPDSVATSVSTAQQWLKDNDSSFYYVYLPKFVTEESVILPTINLNSAKNYISIDTSTSPSNTQLEYIK